MSRQWNPLMLARLDALVFRCPDCDRLTLPGVDHQCVNKEAA